MTIENINQFIDFTNLKPEATYSDIEKLVKVANELDKKGLVKEANELDELIKTL